MSDWTGKQAQAEPKLKARRRRSRQVEQEVIDAFVETVRARGGVVVDARQHASLNSLDRVKRKAFESGPGIVGVRDLYVPPTKPGYDDQSGEEFELSDEELRAWYARHQK